MTKKLISFNILIVSLLMLSACGSGLNIQLTGSNGSAPAQSSSDNTLIFLVIGLVVVVLVIGLIAAVSRRNR